MHEGRTVQRDRPDHGGPAAVDVLFVLAVVSVAAVGLFGGASRENALRLAAVELCTLPLATLAIRRIVRAESPLQRPAAAPLSVLILIAAVPLLQLIPLPPSVWTALPGQTPRLEALGLIHAAPPWLPMTLSPRDTRGVALALIPPVAMWLGTLCLTPVQTRRLGALWIAVGVAGLVVGVAQLATPAGSPAYIYQTTNLGSLVGLFANRNHEAGFLLALLPVAAALTVPSARLSSRPTGARKPVLAPWLAGLFVLISVVALGVIRSRAGIILAGPAVLAALAVLWRGAGGRQGRRIAAGVAVAAGVAAVAVTAFALSPILDRFAPQASVEFRYQAWPYVADAARAFLPWGSGLGSFDRVFEAVEPLTLVAPTYFNHAHNDYLELWLETGWVGAAILGLFLAWLAVAAWRAWMSGSDLARAASAAIVLLMAQSWVDYPLRTETLAMLFAFCCGVLANQGRSEG